MMIGSKIMSFFISFLLLSCVSSRLEAQKLVEQILIKEVYSQGWVAGVRGGGAGIDIYVNLTKPLPKELVLNKVHFKTYEASFEQINTISYIARIRTNQNKLENITLETDNNTEDTIIESPINVGKNKAILFLKKEGKEYSKIVENVEEREMIAYPSMRKPTE